MYFLFLTLLSLASLAGTTQAQSTPPSNDMFSSRILISPPSEGAGTVTVPVETRGATSEPGEPQYLGGNLYSASVWYSFKPQTSGQIRVQVQSFDAILAVFEGERIDALKQVSETSTRSVSTHQRSVFLDFNGLSGTEYQISIVYKNSGVSRSGNLSIMGGGYTNYPRLVSAITPSARTAPAYEPTTGMNYTTAFATIINAGNVIAKGCSISTPSGLLYPVEETSLVFFAERIMPDLNLGQTNENFDLEPGESKFFLVLLKNIHSGRNFPVFTCSNSLPAPQYEAVNSFDFTYVNGLSVDIIASAVTPSRDGMLTIPLQGGNVFALAGLNLGASAPVSVFVRRTAAAKGILNLSICQTNSSGDCIMPPVGDGLTIQADSNQIITLAGFAQMGAEPVSYDPANNRIVVDFISGGLVAGSASIAYQVGP